VGKKPIKELGYTEIENDTMIVGSYGSWRIIYTAGRRGIEADGALKLLFFERDVWNSLQNDDPAKEGYVSVATSGKCRLEARVFNHFMKKEVIVKVRGQRLNPGETIAVTFGDRSEGCPGISVGRNHTAKDYVWKTYVDVKGESNFVNISEPQVVSVVADSPVEILVTAPSIVEAGEPFSLNVKAKDRYGNIADTFAGDIGISCSDPDAVLPGYSFTAKDRGVRDLELTLHREGIQRIEVRSRDGEFRALSNPIVVKREVSGPRIYWGDIHGQTFFSDGIGHPDEYYRYGRDVEKLDFCAITDHDVYLANRTAFGFVSSNPALYGGGYFMVPRQPFWESSLSAWSILKYVTSRFNDPGHFVTLCAYEWTCGDCMTQKGMFFGHKNVYFLSDEGVFYDASKEESDTPQKLWNLLRDKEAFTIPHHTGLLLDSGTSGTDWDHHDDEMQPLVEIYSKWGSSEFYGSTKPLARRIERNRKGGFVQDALARGYRLGFTGGSDIHNARPGAQHQSMFYKRSGLTAVFAHALVRQDIFYALKSRQCYATTGDRTILYFYVNGHSMGKEFTVSSKETPREIEVEVHACKEIQSIDIVKNNEDIYTKSDLFMDARVEWVDELPIEGTDYYYVRVTTVDGEMAWASPIWVSVAEG